MKALHALLALVVLVLLLGGVPILLLAWGDPLALLDVRWTRALLRPDDGTILIGVLSTAGWLAWMVTTATILTELVSVLAHTTIRIHLPGTSWIQPAIGSLVAIAFSPVLPGHADQSPPPVASHAPQEVQPSDSASPSTVTTTSPVRQYIVQAGDELWGVAEREVGHGTDWRSIVACNPGMTADTVLRPGDVLNLPSGDTVPGTGQPTGTAYVTVEEHDTLWDLAEEHLGDALRWPEIFEANRAVVTDPDEIDVGWRLALPADRCASAQADVPPPAPTSDPPPDISTPTAPPSPSTRVSSPDAVEPVGEKPVSATSRAMPVPAGGELSGDDAGITLDMLAPVGGALAASVVAGVMARRQVQLFQRGVGRRIAPIAPSLQRFFAGLVKRSQSSHADPPGLHATAVVVGWREDEDITINLEQARCTAVTGADEHIAGMTAAILTSLLCADWSSDVEVVAVQTDEEWSSALDDPRLSSEDHIEGALIHLQKLCAQRRLELGCQNIDDARADPDRAAMWAPVLFVFCAPLLPAHLDRIRDCLSLGRVGVSIVAASQRSALERSDLSVLHIDSATTATVNNGREFQPQLLSKPARHAVMALLASALEGHTTPAPWWRTGEEPVVTVSPMPARPSKDGAMSAWPTHPKNPTLLVLGPVELLGTSGHRPTRALGQCIEYCAWLLLNPGSTPTVMVRELLVAETTRRSNMSRLRTWLGNDEENNPYLPDAYSGRISLAPSVTSDWERFQSLLAGGVNVSSTPLLREALSLVRGQPLQDMSFQWPWTSQWLTDMTSMISDAATVLADRCLTEQDYAGALWAIQQGQRATGDDEVLAVRRIQVLAHTGCRDDVDAAVMQLTREARATNRELSQDSIRRVQHALHLSTQRVSSARSQ